MIQCLLPFGPATFKGIRFCLFAGALFRQGSECGFVLRTAFN